MATDVIPFYGLDDLKEIVETIATQGAQTVTECRAPQAGQLSYGKNRMCL